MSRFLKIWLLTASLYGGAVAAQIPVEGFAGDKKATIDVMFFRFFKNKEGQNSKFLFFNRNRASIDYKMTETTHLPQLGFTEALSYNHPSLKGFAPVFVAQVFNSGIYPKAGVQYIHLNEKITIFSWLISETQKDPGIDYYILFRFTPAITPKLKLFTQLESLNTIPTGSEDYSFTQRFRLGLKWQLMQYGIGSDLSEKGKDSYAFTSNSGLFLRYEF